MKRLFFAAAALCAMCVVCAAGGEAGAARQASLKVRAKGRRAVVVTERARAHTLDLKEQIDAMRIEKVSAPLVSRAGGFTYLLLDVCGPSKVPRDDRQCGAGVDG